MSRYDKINVAVIGATGYTGLDLVFMLTKHPKVKIRYLCATKNLGKKINFFDKRIKKSLPKISSVKKINWKELDLIFLSLPNGEAQKLIEQKYKKYNHLKFIDLSADFRISNSKIYEKNYNLKHKAKKLIKKSLYSIPELNASEINNYRIISNPGCYPTSIQIPLIPLIKKKLIKIKEITIDSKSGYSGA
jgi:N-acetyl-gamma-glutamyl-phosphate reductase